MKWQQFQDHTAEFFRSLGCHAQVEAKVTGARVEHKIDVWVRFNKFGLETKWVIECKDWNSTVPKEKVLYSSRMIRDTQDGLRRNPEPFWSDSFSSAGGFFLLA